MLLLVSSGKREADGLRYRGDRDPQTEAGTDRETVAPASNTGPVKYQMREEWRRDGKNLSFFLCFFDEILKLYLLICGIIRYI